MSNCPGDCCTGLKMQAIRSTEGEYLLVITVFMTFSMAKSLCVCVCITPILRGWEDLFRRSHIFQWEDGSRPLNERMEIFPFPFSAGQTHTFAPANARAMSKARYW